MNFCDRCHNIQVLKIHDGNIKYYCEICKSYKDIKDKILNTNKFTIDKNINNNLLYGAIYDRTYPKIYEKCTKCDNINIKFFKLDNMKNVYVCGNCKNHWSKSMKN